MHDGKASSELRPAVILKDDSLLVCFRSLSFEALHRRDTNPMLLDAEMGSQAAGTFGSLQPEGQKGAGHVLECQSPVRPGPAGVRLLSPTQASDGNRAMSQEAMGTPSTVLVGTLADGATLARSGAAPPPASPNASQATGNNDDRSCEMRGTSTGGRLKRFTERILRKVASPLLPTVPTVTHEQPSAKLPIWSRRIAAQPLSRVPTSKRGEILVIKRLGFLQEQARPTPTGTDAYNSTFVDRLNPSHEEAMRELFPDAERPVRTKRRGARRA